MPTLPPFSARPLDPMGQSDAEQLANAAGAHGVYVSNALQRSEGEAVLCWGQDELLGLLWFGPRGNLVLIERQPLDPEQVADAVWRSRWPWRRRIGTGGSLGCWSIRALIWYRSTALT